MILLGLGWQIFVLLQRDLEFLLGGFGLIVSVDSCLEMGSTLTEIFLASTPATSFGSGAVRKIVELIRFVVGRGTEDRSVGVRVCGRGGGGGTVGV